MKFTFILLLFPLLFGNSFGQNIEPVKITANGIELHYIEKGKGEPLILLHGGIGDYRFWNLQLDEFAKNYRVISYSRRFHYPNKNSLTDKYRTALTEADDLAAFLRKLNLNKVHLVGQSYGALTALIFAVKNPKTVRSLVLAEPPAHQLIRDLAGGEKLYQDFLNELKPVVKAFNENDERRAMVEFSRNMGRDFDKLPAPTAEAMMQNALAIKAINSSSDPFPKISKDKLRRLKIPTLIITGENTVKIHKFVNEELARLLPNAKEVIVPKAGHGSPRENPQFFNEAALDFLKDSATR